MAIQWTGIFPAVTTKFTKEDTLDIALFTENIKAQIAAGVEGIILGGTLGESSVLTQSEKDRKSTRLNSSHSQQSRMPSSA